MESRWQIRVSRRQNRRCCSPSCRKRSVHALEGDQQSAHKRGRCIALRASSHELTSLQGFPETLGDIAAFRIAVLHVGRRSGRGEQACPPGSPDKGAEQDRSGRCSISLSSWCSASLESRISTGRGCMSRPPGRQWKTSSASTRPGTRTCAVLGFSGGGTGAWQPARWRPAPAAEDGQIAGEIVAKGGVCQGTPPSRNMTLRWLSQMPGVLNGEDGPAHQYRKHGVYMAQGGKELSRSSRKPSLSSAGREIRAPDQVIPAGPVPDAGGRPHHQQVEHPPGLGAAVCPPEGYTGTPEPGAGVCQRRFPELGDAFWKIGVVELGRNSKPSIRPRPMAISE